MPTTCSTIQDQYATCSPEYAEARTHRIDADHAVYLRAHEVFKALRVGTDAGHRCHSEACGHAPIIEVATSWDHRITSDSDRGGPGTWQLGEDWFATWRHADGTGCGMDDLGHRNDDGTYSPAPRYQVFPWARCGACGVHGQLTTKQLAWHDETTCGACGNVTTYQIGD